MIAVVGASGALGRAVVEAAAAGGRDTLAVSRTASSAGLPTAVRAIDVDARSSADLVRALRGAEVVVNAAQSPYTHWSSELPDLFGAVADAAAAVGARLVLVDNLYAYGAPTGPMVETSPELARDTKGVLRARLAREMLARDDLAVTVARASDVLGPHGRATAFGDTFVGSALTKGRVDLVGGADSPHSVAYLPDAGRALLALADDATSSGRVWHLPAEPAVTPRALAALVADAIGRPVRVRVTRPLVARAIGVAVPMLREVAALAHQWDRPFVVDDRAFRARYPDVATTPLPQAVSATVRWFSAARTG